MWIDRVKFTAIEAKGEASHIADVGLKAWRDVTNEGKDR